MKFKDYYGVLGVPRDASLDQIKKAYRKLAREHHPDMAKATGSESRFKEAAEAYATLKDTEKRAAYDALGTAAPGADFSPPPQWRQDYGGGGSAMDDMDLADLFAALGRGHPFAQGSTQPRKGQDHEDTVHISLQDALLGAQMRLQLQDTEGLRELDVRTPPGVRQGQKIRLRGMGGAGRNGGAAGDLYLHVELKPHAVFRPVGKDLYFDLAISPWEATLGAEIKVPTLEGGVLLAVPAGTRSGQKLRLKSRGLTDAKAERGDLYGLVHIETAPHPSADVKKLYAQLAEISQFNPRSAAVSGAHHANADH